MWMWVLLGLVVLVAAVFIRLWRPAKRLDIKETDQATVLLRAEELALSKTREQLARVTTHTEVSRQLQTVTVPVSKEELVVEKDGVEAARIPIREERVDVSTRVVPLNDVAVHQREWKENREVRAVLKKEVARIETAGSATFTEENQPRA